MPNKEKAFASQSISYKILIFEADLIKYSKIGHMCPVFKVFSMR